LSRRALQFAIAVSWKFELFDFFAFVAVECVVAYKALNEL